MVFSSTLVTRFFTFLACVFFSQTLLASMIVDNSVLYYAPGDSSRKDVKVSNPDMEPLYIQVELMEVKNPGTPEEVKVPVVNPKDAGFLVTPNKMAIQPGSEQILRLVNLKSFSDRERVFRVGLKPVVGDVEAEQTGVKILIGYELLVIIQPMAPKIQLSHVREGNKLILENKGNTNVLLQKGTQCKDETRVECTDMQSVRLYAGAKITMDLKYTTPVNYILSSGYKNQNVEY